MPGQDLSDADVNLIRSKDMPLDQLAALSFMFNFNDQNVLSLGQQKVRACEELNARLRGDMDF